MKSALYLIYVLNCMFLILTVLLQAGRGGGMALMGSAGGSSATMFGNRGATTFVQKMTIWSAVFFMSLSILLAFTSMAPSSADRGVIISDEERAAHMVTSDDDGAAAVTGDQGDEAAEGELGTDEAESAPEANEPEVAPVVEEVVVPVTETPESGEVGEPEVPDEEAVTPPSEENENE